MMPPRRRLLVAMLHPLVRRLALTFGALPMSGGVLAAIADTATDPDRFRDAMRRELRGAEAVETRNITVDAPAVAEDGSVVPIAVESHIDATDRLVILVEKNPFPLIAAFQFADRARPYVSLQIKMNESSAVVALARAEGRYYRTAQRVRVVRGGCS